MQSNTLTTLETLGLQVNSLLNELEECFPPVNPTPYDDMNKIMYQSGQRSVVEWLQQRLEE